MIEALKLGFGLLLLGGLLLGAAYVGRSLMGERIPQDEIDAEARQLIADHGADAVSIAEGNVQRSQWAKGKSDSRERAARVLKAVQKSEGLHG